MDLYNYHRRKSTTVQIGDTPMGGDNPIRIQSMTNTSTLDTENSIAQCISIIDAGADYVRLTAQGRREAENLANIRAGLKQQGYSAPLIADIHFNPQAAEVAACNVEKVRINPGNFTDRAKTFTHHDYTDEEYRAELDRIRERLVPFLNICKEHHTAIRLGVNHGSLSDRIMSRYGDTPRGMVESCLEYLRICRNEHFDNVVISIKASNTVIMVETVRMLVEAMDAEDMHYPLHLGVTEAGDGEDGRIKSAVGIGTLLADGIGDTIRVSLSEEPRNEVPVARFLVDYITARAGHPAITPPTANTPEMPGDICTCDIIGAGCTPVVHTRLSLRRKPHAVGSSSTAYHCKLYGLPSHAASVPAFYSCPSKLYAIVQCRGLLCRRFVRRNYRRMAQLRHGYTFGNNHSFVATHQSCWRPPRCRSPHQSFAMQGTYHFTHAIQRDAGRASANESGRRLGSPVYRPLWRRYMVAKQRYYTARRYMRLCLYHFASSTPTHQQDRIYILPELRTHPLRPATDHQTCQRGYRSPQKPENRYHGVYRQRPRRDGRCRLRICRLGSSPYRSLQKERVYRAQHSGRGGRNAPYRTHQGQWRLAGERVKASLVRLCILSIPKYANGAATSIVTAPHYKNQPTVSLIARGIREIFTDNR